MLALPNAREIVASLDHAAAIVAPCPMPLRQRVTLAEHKRRVVKAAVDAAAFSRGEFDAAAGREPRENFAAYLRGWESYYC